MEEKKHRWSCGSSVLQVEEKVSEMNPPDTCQYLGKLFNISAPFTYLTHQAHTSTYILSNTCVLSMCPTSTPWTIARQAPLSMEFSRHEYWSELHFLLQGINLSNPGIELEFLLPSKLAGRFFITVPPGKPLYT